MAKATVVKNYTDAQVIEMIATYKDAMGDSERKLAVDAIATKFGKTVNSVRAKLSREKVYIKPKATTKSGSVIIRKNALVEDIAKVIGVPSSDIESIEKATKTALETIKSKFLAMSMTIDNLELEIVELSNDVDNLTDALEE